MATVEAAERRAIRFILQEIARAGHEWLRNPPSGAVRAKEEAVKRYQPLERGVLEARLGGPTGDFGDEAIYVTPPSDQPNAPTILWCRWDRRDRGCAFWYYLGMWLTHAQFVGFRFEMPERGSNHNFYHCQPCRAIGRRANVINGALPIPVGNPTWPLAAESPVDLLLCAVVSIHGMAGLRELDRTAKQDPVIRDPAEALLPALGRMLGLQNRT